MDARYIKAWSGLNGIFNKVMLLNGEGIQHVKEGSPTKGRVIITGKRPQ